MFRTIKTILSRSFSMKPHQPASAKPRFQLESLEDRLVLSGMVGDLVFFGDSLVDAGNIALATGGASPGALYSNGRFSNGPLWVDTLAEYLREPAVRPSFDPVNPGLNYAFGGATVAYVNTAPPYNTVPQIGQQVGLYLLGGHIPQANDLFAFQGGANDFFFSFQQTGTPINPALPAAAIGDAVETLITFGGRQFIVGNMPLLGQTPYFQDLKTLGYLDQSSIDQINLWCLGFNYYLSLELTQLQQSYPGVKLLAMDTAGMLTEASQPNNPFGVTNWTNTVGTYDPVSGLLTSVTAPNPNEHLFFDAVHPTTTIHQALGLRAAASVYSALGINTLTVDTNADTINPLDGKLSLREMVALANTMPGTQTIRFGTSGLQQINLSGKELSITDNVAIVGSGLTRTILDGQGQSRIFKVAENVALNLSQMTLRNGKAAQGGAIFNAGTLSLDAVIVQDNIAAGGPGQGQGGGIYNTGSLTINVGYFLGNRATGATLATGGAITNVGPNAHADLLGVILQSNQAVGGTLAQGGAVANLNGGSLQLTACLLVSNSALGGNGTLTASAGNAQGGAIYNGLNAYLDLRSCILTANRAVGGMSGGSGSNGKGFGGGIYYVGSSLVRQQGSLILANWATTAGSNLYLGV